MEENDFARQFAPNSLVDNGCRFLMFERFECLRMGDESVGRKVMLNFIYVKVVAPQKDSCVIKIKQYF